MFERSVKITMKHASAFDHGLCTTQAHNLLLQLARSKQTYCLHPMHQLRNGSTLIEGLHFFKRFERLVLKSQAQFDGLFFFVMVGVGGFFVMCNSPGFESGLMCC